MAHDHGHRLLHALATLAVAAIGAAAAPPRLFAEMAFQEAGGQVVLEAEHYDSTIPRSPHAWALGTTQAGYAGDAYVEALPNQGTNRDTGYVTASPELIYHINFTTTGTYYVWVRGSAPAGTDDSLHAGLDGQATPTANKVTGFKSTDWVWKRERYQETTPATLDVASPGLHTLHLWMREDGLKIDRVLLRTSSSSSAPSGQGPAESPRSGEPPQPPPPVATPTISPNGGAFEGSVTISLATATPDASIRYTTDGSAPSSNSPLYTMPFSLTSTATVKAQAFAADMTDSAVASAAFTITAAPPPPDHWTITLEAEDMPTKTTGGAVTDGWNIWSEGYIEDTVQFPTLGAYQFDVVAYGKQAAGVWPRMEVRIDQQVIATVTVNSTSWKTFTVQGTVSMGSHGVAIAFTNDYRTSTEDRNLYVDQVTASSLSSSPPPPDDSTAPVITFTSPMDREILVAP